MCLLTYQKEPIILEEDKIVWKKMDKFEDKIFSVYFNFRWELNKLYEIEIKTTNYFVQTYDTIQYDRYFDTEINNYRKGTIKLTKGFHSFNNKEYAIEDTKSSYYYLFECKIPKGSEYYEDETGLCISNKIIIIKQLNIV